MNRKENLKMEIERERKKLDELTLGDDMIKVYRQSLVVDKLVEEYLDLMAS